VYLTKPQFPFLRFFLVVALHNLSRNSLAELPTQLPSSNFVVSMLGSLHHLIAASGLPLLKICMILLRVHDDASPRAACLSLRLESRWPTLLVFLVSPEARNPNRLHVAQGCSVIAQVKAAAVRV